MAGVGYKPAFCRAGILIRARDNKIVGSSVLRHIDFKALDVFLQVMRHGSIGSAAAALGMRVPTVVYAIRKLREVTGDQLFLERRGSLVPTVRGLKLEKPPPACCKAGTG
ncbi:helix-turn-helix domain-containing protein [Cupriavidus basilensis]